MKSRDIKTRNRGNAKTGQHKRNTTRNSTEHMKTVKKEKVRVIRIHRNTSHI